MQSGDSSPTPNTRSGTGEGRFSDEQKRKAVFFFGRLQLIYGSRFVIQWPDERTVQLARREWAKTIDAHTWPQLEKALERAKGRLVAGDADFYWPDVGRILGLGLDAHCAAHRTFQRALPEGDCLKQARRVAGRQGLSRVWAVMRGGYAD